MHGKFPYYPLVFYAHMHYQSINVGDYLFWSRRGRAKRRKMMMMMMMMMPPLLHYSLVTLFPFLLTHRIILLGVWWGDWSIMMRRRPA